MPAELFQEFARLSKNVKGPGDVVTDDALLCGWLHVQLKTMDWQPRFFQLRSGTLTSFSCRSWRATALSEKTVVKQAPMPENASRWLRSDITVNIVVSDALGGKGPGVSLFCSQAQGKVFQDSLNMTSRGVPVRLIICFRPDAAGGAPLPVLVRITPTVMFVFDLEDVLEYTLMGLHLEPTDQPASVDHPFGLRISSAVSDQMFVPLENLFVASPSPHVILQWNAALKTADLDPPPAQPVVNKVVAGVNGVMTRDSRSGSGALLAQLVSDAVGQTSGSFSGVSDLTQPESTQHTKKRLEELLAGLKFDASNPIPLSQALLQPDYQEALAAFCKTIFTEENVNFCIAVEKFRNCKDTRAKQASARTIVAEFINYSGKSVVDINAATRKRVEDISSSGVPVPPNMFDQAVDEVRMFIEQDSWPKFLARLTELKEETLMNEEDHSWDSGDSSSYEEREGKKKSGSTRNTLRMRAGSLGNVSSNDFGEETELNQAEVERIRQEVGKAIEFDPKDPPPLKILLAKKVSRELLKRFAKTILAEENVTFWEQVQRFKASDDLEQRKTLVKMLFDEYIPSGSKTMVNIAGSERSRLMKLYQEQGLRMAETKTAFDVALVECVKVMELDLYPKFLQLAKDFAGQHSAAKQASAKSQIIRVPPLWEILNGDPTELNSFLLFAASNNQQDDILFWCLVERFHLEPDAETRNKLGHYIMQSYVSSNAPRMIRVDKAKKAACIDRYNDLVSKKANLPTDLYDAMWRDVQTTMNKHLHPAYEKAMKKPKKGADAPKSAHGNMLEDELNEALREDESKHRGGWVVVKKETAPEETKKSLLGGGRRKVATASTPPK